MSFFEPEDDDFSDDDFNYEYEGEGLFKKLKKTAKKARSTVKQAANTGRKISKEVRKNPIASEVVDTIKEEVPFAASIEKGLKYADKIEQNVDTFEDTVADFVERVKSDPAAIAKEVAGYVDQIDSLKDEVKYYKDKAQESMGDDGDDVDMGSGDYYKQGGFGPVAAFAASYVATKAADYAYDKYGKGKFNGGLSTLPYNKKGGLSSLPYSKRKEGYGRHRMFPHVPFYEELYTTKV